jgi:hypothetical protein
MIKTPELARAGVAVLLACALWLVVSAEESTSAWVPVHVILTLDTTVVLADSPAPVRALITGRRRDLFKLISSPLTLQRAVTDDARDSVRIELREQDLDIPPGTDVTVRNLQPRLITVRLRRTAAEVPVSDTPMPSQRADATTLSPRAPEPTRDTVSATARDSVNATRRDLRRPPS